MKEPIYRLYSSLSESEPDKIRAEVSLGALRRNYRALLSEIRRETPKVRPIAVVKAEAYGHGTPACVDALLEEGCDFFAVSCINEALAVRQTCDNAGKHADILILGYTDPKEVLLLAEAHLLQALLSETYAHRLNAAAAAAGVVVHTHIALDTGMNRIGYPAHSEAEALSAADAIVRTAALPRLRPDGMFTHFSRADEAPGGEGDALTRRQIARYLRVRALLEERGIRIPFHHVCNSAAALRYPFARFDGVRLGILLYGIAPSPFVSFPLEPVMQLRTVISHIHPLLPNECVGYGGTFSAGEERRIATLPIGYADGLLRAYSGASVTLLTGSGAHRVPIVGKICMDQCMIDVTGSNAAEGDTVVFFGDTPDALPALSAHAETIPYESLCLISSRVPRVYREEFPPSPSKTGSRK